MERPSVFVVDDNPTDVFLIQEAIEREKLDLNLQIFEDGEAAIGLIEKLDVEENSPGPQLILLDLNLPKADGFEVLSRLRNSRRCAGVPVIVMTSSSAAPDIARSNALGANDYFQKPSGYAAFLAIGHLVRLHLRNRAFGGPCRI